jgi:hypothetical protein
MLNQFIAYSIRANMIEKTGNENTRDFGDINQSSHQEYNMLLTISD